MGKLNDDDKIRTRNMARAIRAIMQFHGITRDELAEKINVQPRTFDNKLGRGTLSAIELIQIAEIYGATVRIDGGEWNIPLNAHTN